MTAKANMDFRAIFSIALPSLFFFEELGLFFPFLLFFCRFVSGMGEPLVVLGVPVFLFGIDRMLDVESVGRYGYRMLPCQMFHDASA